LCCICLVENGRAEYILYLVGRRVEFLICHREGLHLATFVAGDNHTYFKFKVHKCFEHARGIWDMLYIFFAAANYHAKAVIATSSSLPHKWDGPTLASSFKFSLA
jgi:hypothetical protein